MSLTKDTKFDRRRSHDFDEGESSYDWLAECDTGDSRSCEGAVNIDDSTFKEAGEKLKSFGWQIFKNSKGEWTHRCQICKEWKMKHAFEEMKR
jgi:hypothetical protein